MAGENNNPFSDWLAFTLSYRALVLGSAVISTYDGTSFAENQDVVFVTFNYRLNVFGFPEASDLPLSHNNLGFLDQELVLAWVQDNIAQFGGDKSKVTIMVRMISSDMCGHTTADLCTGRAILQGLSPYHLPSPAGNLLSLHHFVQP